MKRHIINFLSKSARHSLARREKFVIAQLGSLPNGSRILDAGAGEMKYRKYCRHLRYTSQDFCLYDGAGDGKSYQNGTWATSEINIRCDISHIPLDGSTFDAILCTDVLEHLPNPIDAFREFKRLLRQGGILIMVTPTACEAHQSPYFFSAGYSNHFYNHHLGMMGFSLQMEYESGYLQTIDQKLYLGAKAVLAISRKSLLGTIFFASYLTLSLGLITLIRLFERLEHPSLGLSDYANNGILVVARKA